MLVIFNTGFNPTSFSGVSMNPTKTGGIELGVEDDEQEPH
jgi:hypothetical protein